MSQPVEKYKRKVFVDSEPLWKLEDLGRFLKISVEAVRIMWKRGQIPQTCAIRIGRRLRFIPKRIQAWIEKRT